MAKIYRKIFFLILFGAGFIVPSAVLASTGTIDSTNKYAWADSAGWINFNPANGNVSISDSALTGYVWNELYGWINLAPAGSGVTNTTSGVLSGYAWGENTSWINFSGMIINCDGKFVGNATGDTIGTINFNCANCKVYTSWRPSSGCGAGSPPPSPPPPPPSPPPPPASHNECSAQKQCVSVAGEGVSQCSGNNDCQIPKHNECNVQSQCVAVDGEEYDQCQANNDCLIVEHNECNDLEQCVSVNGLGFNQCETNIDCGPTHNICNSSLQCIIAEGIGADRCQKNEDCFFKTPPEAPPPPPSVIPPATSPAPPSGIIIETPINIIKAVTQTAKEQIQEVFLAEAETVKAAVKEVKKIIETPQGSVVTKTISTTGAVVATAQITTAIIFSPLETLFIFIRLSGIFLTALGIKRRVKSWGVAYDSVTKQPIDPAYITLKDLHGKNVASAITDLDGRYGFLVDPGIYQMSANKTNYFFPSQKLAGKMGDELYNDLYFGENIEIKQDGQAIIKNIPMDPLRFDWNEFAKRDKKLMKFYSKIDIILRKIFDLFFVAGFIVALVAYFSVPYPYNLIILIIYLALLFLRTIGIKPKAYGSILSSIDGNPLSFSILRVIMPDSNVEVAHKVADKYGRYYCLAPKGKYYIKIEKKNDDGSYSLIYTSPLIDVSRKGIIKKIFKV